MMRFEVDEKTMESIRKVRLLVLDVDGVLTDGRIVYDSEGRETKIFDAQDGLGVRLLRAVGIKTILVTAKPSEAIGRRAQDMRVEKCYEGIWPKTRILDEILQQQHVTEEEICFVGDDLVDLCMMEKAGFPVAVANAREELKEAARYITQRSGGRGAVREIAELILMTQGKWHEALEQGLRPSDGWGSS